MKTKDFKELCAVYTANPNLDNENMLLRTMAFDTTYYVIVEQSKEGIALNLIENENNEYILSVYTSLEDIDKSILKSQTIGEIAFDDILENVNAIGISYIVINPNSESLTLTAAQLAKLHREKYYAESNFPLSLEMEENFKARAVRLSDAQTTITSNKVMEIYKDSLNEKNEKKRKELFDSFLEELVNHTKFYTTVLPSGNTDAIGNLVVEKDRVIYMMTDGLNGEYYLFTNAQDIAKNIELDPEKTYISVFDFEDYVTMMDASFGKINGIRIVGEYNIPISKEDIYRYNAIKKLNILKKDMTVLKGTLAPSEETENIETALQDYLQTEKKVSKAWLGREIELYKNGKDVFVYNLILKLEDKNIDKAKVKEQVRKILGNRLFVLYSTDEDVKDEQLKCIYKKKISSKKTATKTVQ